MIHIKLDEEDTKNSLLDLSKFIRSDFWNCYFMICSFSKANYSMKDPEKIGTVYFLCSQSPVLNDFKNSNRNE